MLPPIMGASSGDTRIDISGMIGLPAESSVYKTMAAVRDLPRLYDKAYMVRNDGDVHSIRDGSETEKHAFA
jgi:hypothetical protein